MEELQQKLEPAKGVYTQLRTALYIIHELGRLELNLSTQNS